MPVDPMAFDRDNPIHELSLADLADLSTCHGHNLGKPEIGPVLQVGPDLLLQRREKLVDGILKKDNDLPLSFILEQICQRAVTFRKGILGKTDAMPESHRDIEIV